MCCVRTLLFLMLASSIGIAQVGRGGGRQGGPPPGPLKNLKILPADVNIQQTMGVFRAALGVQCTYCHVRGDFASDDNPKKNVARNMLRIAADINAEFPDGKRHVTCYTCHHGETKPKTEAGEPGAPKRGPGRGK